MTKCNEQRCTLGCWTWENHRDRTQGTAPWPRGGGRPEETACPGPTAEGAGGTTHGGPD